MTDLQMIARYPALASFVLGVVAALGFAPLDLWPLTLAGLGGWLWLVHAAPSLRGAIWRGWLFGVGHFTFANNWIKQAFEYQDAMPPALGYGAVVALALYLAVYPMLAAGLAWRLARWRHAIDAPFVLTAGAAWTVTEWLRGGMFTGYAWDPIAVVWVPVQPVAAVAGWTGTYGLSGLTVALAGAGVLALRRTTTRRAWLWGLVGAVGATLQALSYPSATAPAVAPEAPRLRIVQPGIGQDARGEQDQEAMLNALIAASGTPGPAPRLILWPEGVLRDYVEDGYPLRYIYWQRQPPEELRRRLAAILGPRDILLFGGNALQFDARGELQTATNAVFALNANARLVGRYDKAHLVPYGEYLPMRGLLAPLGLSQIVPGDIDFRDGPGPRGLSLGTFGLIGMQICYEIIFSGQVLDAAHRPALLFNPSNDAWFGRFGPPQHFAQARLRAIEEGMAVVRATPTGISSAIGPDGRVLATVPGHGAGAVELPLPPRASPTLFARLGNWLAFAVAALLAASAVALRRRAR
jgi:apolipoprotein N-acyltransferase